MWFFNRLTLWGCAVFLMGARRLLAEESIASSWVEAIKKQAEDTMLSKTLGGRQFWGDVHHLQGWRIQQNVFTKHFRLLDPDDFRFATGSFEECENVLNNVATEKKLEPMKGTVVIMIHGLLQSSKCMSEMDEKLTQAGYTTVEFDYPSTQVSIPEAAEYLDRLIKSLGDDVDEINFVVHSMGGLVVRAYDMEYHDPRLKRMVMLGTPNQGAELADITQQYWILRTAAGPGARQLSARPDGLISKLPVPKFEFAVIAGCRGTPSGWNPLIPGDDDGTDTVASTRLAGAADFCTVNAMHSRLLWHEESVSQTINFLKDGRLRSDGEPQPIREIEPASAVK